jgi:surface antigen
MPIRLLAAFLIAVLFSGNTLAQNTMFLRNSPIAHLDDQDREILRDTIDKALTSADGTVIEWENAESGSRGRVKVLDTTNEQGMVCRSLRARNEAHGRKADGIYRLCKADDGEWRFASPAQSSADNSTPAIEADE